jgi:hypothetical protein
MSELLKQSLMRSALILVTIFGALYVFGVIFNLREGTAHWWQLVVGIAIIGALVLLNRWWFRRSGTRI